MTQFLQIKSFFVLLVFPLLVPLAEELSVTVRDAVHTHSLPMLEGLGTSEALRNVRERIWPIMKANWMLWPAVQVRMTQTASLIPRPGNKATDSSADCGLLWLT